MRTFTRSVLIASAAGFAALAMPTPADAGLVVQTITLGSAMPDWSGTSARAVSFSKFDSSLGTLTNVRIGVSTTVTGSLSVNGGTVAHPITVNPLNANSTIAVLDPFNPGCSAGDNSIANCNALGGARVAIVTIPSAVLTSDQSFTGINTTGTSSDAYSVAAKWSDFVATATATPDVYFSDFTGTGTIQFEVASDTSLGGVITGGTLSLIQTTFASAAVTVTYTFNTPAPGPALLALNTPAPEPASLALLGVGLAALGAVRRRKAQG